MPDGSSIRIKRAQHVVNQKLKELQTSNAQIKLNDWTFLQALPQFEHILDEQEQPPSASAIQQHVIVDQPPQRPPLFPTPTDDHVSWKDLLDFEKHRRIPPETMFPPRLPGDDSPESPPEQPGFPLRYPPWYKVAIIGAGVAGLRTAKLLQDMGIPYKIFEASDRPGGRVFTYEFKGEPKGKHDYYDVGAMRFPDNEANEKTFALFRELGLENKLVKYVFSREDSIYFFNNIKATSAVASTAGDHFRDTIVPNEYLNKTYTDPWDRSSGGVDACTNEAFDPFRQALLDDFDKGWEKLMEYDWASTRSYLKQGVPKYPLSVVQWMETRNSGTNGYETAFSEDVLDSLEFDDPTKNVEWHCFDGGTRLLIPPMLDQLAVKPSYGQRVSSVEQVFLSPHVCFPDLPSSPHWPDFPLMKVSVGEHEEFFGHVVSTCTFSDLRTIDTERVPMTYKQRQATRTLTYGAAVKVGIKFKSRWWEKNGLNQFGASSYTDRQCRVVVYPSAGLGEDGPGVLMATYSWNQDANRLGALIKTPDWSEQLEPDRVRPWSEKILLDQLYADLAVLHDVGEDWLRDETLDYHAYEWYQNPFTMGAYASYGPGQFNLLFPDIVQPAAYGRFHFAGEVASTHHAWVSGALDSAVRVVDEILRWDFPRWIPKFRNVEENGFGHGRSLVFGSDKAAEQHFVKGLFAQEFEKQKFH